MNERIVFMGTPDFSVPILKALVDKFNVVLVVSQPDKPVGRKRVLTAPPVASTARDLNIPLIQPENISDSEVLETIKSNQPDIIITAAYGQILKENLLNLPKHHAINVHASLLPKHRGGAPIHRAIIEGDDETGVTIMYMEKGLDSGDIISQSAIPILDTDTTGTLHDKLSQLGTELLLETLPDIFNNSHSATPQDESLVTVSPNISKDDEKIDWTLSAASVDYQIRGLSPWPGAYTTHQEKRFKIYFSKVSAKESDAPEGTIVEATEDGFLVVCGDGKCIEILEVQPSGKKKMNAKNFIMNNQKFIGEQFI